MTTAINPSEQTPAESLRVTTYELMFIQIALNNLFDTYANLAKSFEEEGMADASNRTLADTVFVKKLYDKLLTAHQNGQKIEFVH